jgi:hypothetical protein
MPRNGSGTYSLPAGNPVVTGTTISSTVQNNTTSDIATALTNSLAKDGQTTPTANLPMGGFKLTGLAAGSVAGDSLRYEQLIGVYLPLAGGTATGDIIVPDEAYDETAWNANLEVPTKNAIRDKLVTFNDNLLVSGTGLVGYTTGAGGSVTQITSKSTAVTLNKATGRVVTHNASLASGAAVVFVVNNSLVSENDVPVATIVTNTSDYSVSTTGTAAGVFAIRLVNVSGGALAQAVPINFAIIKGVNS